MVGGGGSSGGGEESGDREWEGQGGGKATRIICKSLAVV